MDRIGIYGGTFNPPHLGHVRVAQYAVEALGLRKLLVIPACVSPHKKIPGNSPTPAQRLEMMEICFAEDEKIQVSDIELQRGGPSYTYETVAQVKKLHPDAELVLFMGTDMFLSFLTWKKPEEILKNVSLAVFYRGQRNEKGAILTQKEVLEKMGARVYLVDNPVTTISSSDLRRMIRFRCAEPLLPPGIWEYISKNELYGVEESLRHLSIEQLEQAVTALLKPSRVNHVLGCRDTAVGLAKRWGADETDAARAGLLHDITKALDGPLQLTLCKAYGIILDDFFVENPKTIHALTGSLVAQRIFGENNNVVQAIASHTTGKKDMSLLEKIIYVADYVEPNRDFDGVETLRYLADTNIDNALKLGLETTIGMLREQGRTVSPQSQQALAWLENKQLS